MQGNEPVSQQTPQTTQNLRIYKIILFIEIILIAMLTITDITVKVFHSASGSSIQASELDLCKHRTKAEILNIVNNITKEEAISVIKNMHDENRCFPAGMLPEKFKLKPTEFAHKILYSYDDASEVPDIAQASVMGVDTESADDFIIDETTDYYTIISVDDSKVPCEESSKSLLGISCYRGISFNKKYLNHYREDTGSSSNDRMVFNDLSTNFVELALKIIMVNDMWNSNSLFDYYFEDNGDKFTLTGIYFGVGLDLENASSFSASNIPYAINIYERKISLDKSTKTIAWEKHDSGYGGEATLNTIRSFSLSNDDLFEIQAAIYNLSDDEKSELKTLYRDEDEMTDAEMLEARVTAICGKDYSTVFKTSDNSGIFKCNDYTKAIYLISNPDRTEEDYKTTAYANFLGTDDDEIVNEFFGDKIYIYQDYRNASIDDRLILLLESPSEDSLIEDNLDTINNFIQKLNEKYSTDLTLYIFYTEDLSHTSDLKDYIILSGIAGVNSWMPNGNGFGNYYYKDDQEMTPLKELSENPSLYSSQTRDAIKFHRHIQAEITGGTEFPRESLKRVLQNSFRDGL